MTELRATLRTFYMIQLQDIDKSAWLVKRRTDDVLYKCISIILMNFVCYTYFDWPMSFKSKDIHGYIPLPVFWDIAMSLRQRFSCNKYGCFQRSKPRYTSIAKIVSGILPQAGRHEHYCMYRVTTIMFHNWQGIGESPVSNVRFTARLTPCYETHSW